MPDALAVVTNDLKLVSVPKDGFTFDRSEAAKTEPRVPDILLLPMGNMGFRIKASTPRVFSSFIRAVAPVKVLADENCLMFIS